MEKLLYFWVDKSSKRATNSTGIRANWTNCLLYILKLLLNLHNFPNFSRHFLFGNLCLFSQPYLLAMYGDCEEKIVVGHYWDLKG